MTASGVPAREAGPTASRGGRPAREARPASAFAVMGLSKVMLAALDEAEYLEPTPIQAGLIPRRIEGIDLMGQAQTGTGKTAAFGIPILEKLRPRMPGDGPQALILVPTRELAVQVRDECIKLAAGRDVRITAVYGGKPLRKQVEELRRGVEVVVGTPGRVLDLMGRGSLILACAGFVVLDEADRMLDIGFRPDMEKILRRCPQSRQTLLLSTTIPPPVKKLAERYMQPRNGRFFDERPGRRDDRPVVLHGRPGAEVRSAGQTNRARAAPAGDCLLPNETRHRQGPSPVGRCSPERRHDPRRSSAIGPRPRDAASGTGKRRCWWPPTWSAAAST